MRNQWRLLLRHHQLRCISSSTITRPLSLLQVTPKPNSPLSLSSFNSSITSHFHNPNFPRHFSSVVQKSNDASIVISIFDKSINGDEIKSELVANNVVINRDLVLNVIANLNDEPKTAIRFFDWVLERENELVGSKVYNFMLGVLGSNLYVNEFWEMIDCMRKKGYGVRKGAYEKVLEKFEKEGSQDDVERLKDLFRKDLNRVELPPKGLSPVELPGARIFDLIKRVAWDEVLEKQLIGLNISYSSELVEMVLERLDFAPMKGLIFFRWLEEKGLFKHDQRTYNAMVVVLGREDYVDRFWSVVKDMSNAGYEMERETFVRLLNRFVKGRMWRDSVGLFEMVMNGANKPSRQDCVFLLKKIAVAEELDMELFSRVVEAFTGKGFALDDSMFDSVLKSLTSVGRMRMCNKVLDSMVKSGFRPSAAMQSRVAFDLSSSDLTTEANEFMVKLDGYGMSPDGKTWASLIEGHCVSGHLAHATKSFKKMVERGEAASAGHVLDLLVNAYCDRNRAIDACVTFSDLVNNKDLIPEHTTYKTLINKLTLKKKGFKEALNLLGLMKNHGFPPFLEPLIGYLVKQGTSDEALLFFDSMTVKNFPSTKVFHQVFEAYFMAGKPKKAQNLMAKCPKHIRNNADVLNLFCSMKRKKPAEPAAVTT